MARSAAIRRLALSTEPALDGDLVLATVLSELDERVAPNAAGPAFTVVEAHLRAGIAHLALGERDAAAGAAEEALAADDSRASAARRAGERRLIPSGAARSAPRAIT